MVGIIFSGKNDMHTYMGDMGGGNQSANLKGHSRRLLMVSDFLHSIFAVFKTDFQGKNKVWKITDILGITSVLYSFLDGMFNKDFFNGMPSGFRFSMYIFALGYFLLVLLRGYERYRSEKLENDKKQYLWDLRKKLLGEKIENSNLKEDLLDRRAKRG